MTPVTLKEIWIYPIKSLGGIELQTASVRQKGLQFDRRWMLINTNGVAMTQRVHPAMALFKVRLQEGFVHVDYKKNGETLDSKSFAIHERKRSSITADVWGNPVQVHEVNQETSQWFSELLRTTCRLVAFPEENPRPVDPNYSVGNDHVSLADAYPYLIIGQASLDDLNRRMDESVPMNRFRPNFVFDGGAPFFEDTWRNLTIGNVPFMALKKSDRCVLTTINQDTAEKSTEPLRTLSNYRKVGKNVFFGQNLIALKEGQVSVGDPIIPL